MVISSAGRRPRQRSKTFTGCWTCRARHVKCDEGKPLCQRCLRNGWPCEGYDIRLEWSEVTSRDSASQRRRAKPMVIPPEQCLSSKAVTGLLTDLDNHSYNATPCKRGPFSVFPVLSTEPVPSQPGGNTESVPASGISSRQRSMIVESPTTGSDASPVTYSSRDTGQSLLGELSPVNHNKVASNSLPSALPPRPCGQNAQEITIPSDPDQERPDDIDSADTQPTSIPEPGHPNHRFGLSLIRNMSPQSLPIPQSELVHHWVTFVSGNVLLVDTPDNPCRTIYVPIALQGAVSDHVEFSMHHTVFHAICSASAFSLYHLRGDERYQSLGLTHDQLALHHLRHNLGRASNAIEPALAAVLSCVTAEAISGRRHRWRTHLVGALALLEEGNDGRWTRSPAAASMLQSYLSLASLCSLRMSTQLVSLLDGPAELNNYLERSHGMTRPLVRFLARVIEISDSKKLVPPETLDGLELQLYLSCPCLSTPNTQDENVIWHAVNAFYYATVIYFRRTLRRASSTAVQDLVEQAVENLEAAEALSQGKGGTAYNWPSLVVAAECLSSPLQYRMLTWFQRKRRHGLQSIDVIRNLVSLLWERREATVPGADIHWQDIAKEADFDIMFV